MAVILFPAFNLTFPAALARNILFSTPVEPTVISLSKAISYFSLTNNALLVVDDPNPIVPNFVLSKVNTELLVEVVAPLKKPIFPVPFTSTFKFLKLLIGSPDDLP